MNIPGLFPSVNTPLADPFTPHHPVSFTFFKSSVPSAGGLGKAQAEGIGLLSQWSLFKSVTQDGSMRKWKRSPTSSTTLTALAQTSVAESVSCAMTFFLPVKEVLS